MQGTASGGLANKRVVTCVKAEQASKGLLRESSRLRTAKADITAATERPALLRFQRFNQRPETTDGATRQSEGIAQLAFLCPARQGGPSGCSDLCLRALPCQRRCRGRRWTDVCGHRSVRARALPERTGGPVEKQDVSSAGGSAVRHVTPGAKQDIKRDLEYTIAIGLYPATTSKKTRSGRDPRFRQRTRHESFCFFRAQFSAKRRM
jgi:hypothetical protein